jgi:acetyl-CoA carboxylase biotin carboxyl carrier protein
MTIEEIKQLIHLVNETGIAELQVTRGDNRVRIRGANAGIVARPAQEFTAAASMAGNAASAGEARTLAPTPIPPAPEPPPAPTAAVESERTVYVKSPIVGTFYESPSPGAPPFVKPGDHVSVGQVLCIIESMKLMNEIESDVAGTVVARLVESGRPVEYGESLFAINPA